MVVVDGGSRTAWADKNGDGKVDSVEALDGLELEGALAAAAEIEYLFVAPVPSTLTRDSLFEVVGVASPSEVKMLADGGSIRAERSKLAQHLDFFDSNRDGKLSAGEVFRGFRSVGISWMSSMIKTMSVLVLFGDLRRGFQVLVDSTSVRRYRSATGIYDSNGRVSEIKLSEFLAHFNQTGGALTSKELMSLLKAKRVGGVSRRQFGALLSVCEKINGSKTITAEQFRRLFDGSLLWLAASLTNSKGHRGLRGARR